MKVLDLYSGTGSATQAFKDAGHQVVRIEIEHTFDADVYADITHLYPYDIEHLGPFDFIWASPPCTVFSVAALGMKHWKGDRPQTAEAQEAIDLVAHTIRLIASLTPKFWVMENPRGMLRKLEVVRGIPLTEITYCQYGERYQKATDLFGVLPHTFTGRKCERRDTCHDSSPRSEKHTGLQSIPKQDRSRVPYALGEQIMETINAGMG